MQSGLRVGNRQGDYRRRKSAIAQPQPPADVVELTFASNGDTNGLFYYLGTSQLTQTWANPHPTQIFTTVSGTNFDGAPLTDRQQTGASFYTDNVPSSFMRVDLGLGLKFAPNYYTLQVPDTYIPRSWNLQGSNDNTTWDDLHVVLNQTYSAFQWVGAVVSPPDRYRYFRVLQTGLNQIGDNFLVISELELYGTLYI